MSKLVQPNAPSLPFSVCNPIYSPSISDFCTLCVLRITVNVAVQSAVRFFALVACNHGCLINSHSCRREVFFLMV